MTKWHEHTDQKDLQDSISYFKDNNNILHIWKLKFLDKLNAFVEGVEKKYREA